MIVIVIPARIASTRLPGKLLLEIESKSILQRTYEQACKSKLAQKVVIATDDEKIFEHARNFGAMVEMTSANHQSGSDRIAELTRRNSNWQIIVNVQGDEPFINPADIDKAIETFIHDPLVQISSIYHKITSPDEINNPNNVKVVTDLNSYALYFSRAVIPYIRHPERSEGSSIAKFSEPDGSSRRCAPQDDGFAVKKHIGLYAYRRDALLTLTQMPQSPLELSEKLEQLRALENGMRIKMLEVKSAPIGIDTEEDYQKAIVIARSA